MVAVATLVGITLSFVSLTGGYMVVKQRGAICVEPSSYRSNSTAVAALEQLYQSNANANALLT